MTLHKGLTAITYNDALRYRAVVIERDSTSATIAVVREPDEKAIEALTRVLRRPVIKTKILPEQDFATLLRSTYPNDEGTSGESALDQLVKIIDTAYNTHVTDLHFERRLDGGGRIRSRRDGDVQSNLTQFINNEKIDAFVNLIITNANIRSDQPHPGQVWKLKLPSGRTVEIRVQITETIRGKEASLRLVGMDSRLFRLNELGMPQDIFRKIVQYIRGLEGGLVVVGPTNSGKSTLQRAIGIHVDELKKYLSKGRVEARQVSIEMPVELQLDHTQVSLIEGAPVDFAFMTPKAVRTDYDYLNLGEINATNVMAFFNLALASRLVVGSFHARNSIGAFIRLLDMDVKLSTIDNALRGIIACRTLPKLCPECRIESRAVDMDSTSLFKGVLGSMPARTFEIGDKLDCATCGGNGTVGLKTFYELLSITPKLIKAARVSVDHQTLYDAVSEDFKQMGEYVLPALEAGEITAESAITLLHAG